MARLLLLHVHCSAHCPQIHLFTRRRPRCPFRYQFDALHRHECTQITTTQYYFPWKSQERLCLILALDQGETRDLDSTHG